MSEAEKCMLDRQTVLRYLYGTRKQRAPEFDSAGHERVRPLPAHQRELLKSGASKTAARGRPIEQR